MSFLGLMIYAQCHDVHKQNMPTVLIFGISALGCFTACIILLQKSSSTSPTERVTTVISSRVKYIRGQPFNIQYPTSSNEEEKEIHTNSAFFNYNYINSCNIQHTLLLHTSEVKSHFHSTDFKSIFKCKNKTLSTFFFHWTNQWAKKALNMFLANKDIRY